MLLGPGYGRRGRHLAGQLSDCEPRGDGFHVRSLAKPRLRPTRPAHVGRARSSGVDALLRALRTLA
eukprot:11999249-Alexandrium_andersonii.AAC.1